MSSNVLAMDELDCGIDKMMFNQSLKLPIILIIWSISVQITRKDNYYVDEVSVDTMLRCKTSKTIQVNSGGIMLDTKS